MLMSHDSVAAMVVMPERGRQKATMERKKPEKKKDKSQFAWETCRQHGKAEVRVTEMPKEEKTRPVEGMHAWRHVCIGIVPLTRPPKRSVLLATHTIL